ncbi:MAG: heavy metal translocating P-type ATPase, partial [Parafannyhessea sp.]
MRYTIVSELPGRLHLRCGALLMDGGEARGVAKALMGLNGVRQADVHPSNGSILVVFAPATRDEVLLAVRSLDVLALPTAEPGVDEASGAIEVRTENNRFAMEVTRLAGAHFLRRLLLPTPLRAMWVTFQALRFVAMGLAHLVRGELTVEVLDATAITASILRGSFDEAGTIIFFLQLSSAMERHVQSRSHLALRGNMITRAESVWVVRDGQDVRIPIED